MKTGSERDQKKELQKTQICDKFTRTPLGREHLKAFAKNAILCRNIVQNHGYQTKFHKIHMIVIFVRQKICANFVLQHQRLVTTEPQLCPKKSKTAKRHLPCPQLDLYQLDLLDAGTSWLKLAFRSFTERKLLSPELSMVAELLSQHLLCASRSFL